MKCMLFVFFVLLFDNSEIFVLMFGSYVSILRSASPTHFCLFFFRNGSWRYVVRECELNASSVSSHFQNASSMWARIPGMRAQWARISRMRRPSFVETNPRIALVVEFFFFSIINWEFTLDLCGSEKNKFKPKSFWIWYPVSIGSIFLHTLK